MTVQIHRTISILFILLIQRLTYLVHSRYRVEPL